MKKIFSLLLSLVLLISFVGCSEEKTYQTTLETTSSAMQLSQPSSGDMIAEIVTSEGTIKIRLFEEQAPLAVENFTSLIEDGYYNNVTFHRVLKDFIIQSGDPTGTGAGGESVFGVDFEDEFSELMHHYTGALSMANSGQDTNGSQFFIVATPTNSLTSSQKTDMENNGYSDEVITAYEEIGGVPYLDYVHTVFGQVYEGIDVVYKIADTEVDNNSKPEEDITIISATVSVIE